MTWADVFLLRPLSCPWTYLDTLFLRLTGLAMFCLHTWGAESVLTEFICSQGGNGSRQKLILSLHIFQIYTFHGMYQCLLLFTFYWCEIQLLKTWRKQFKYIGVLTLIQRVWNILRQYFNTVNSIFFYFVLSCTTSHADKHRNKYACEFFSMLLSPPKSVPAAYLLSAESCHTDPHWDSRRAKHFSSRIQGQSPQRGLLFLQ